jgi:hypothetical protein
MGIPLNGKHGYSFDPLGGHQPPPVQIKPIAQVGSEQRFHG